MPLNDGTLQSDATPLVAWADHTQLFIRHTMGALSPSPITDLFTHFSILAFFILNPGVAHTDLRFVCNNVFLTFHYLYNSGLRGKIKRLLLFVSF